MESPPPLWISHRGLHQEYPENSAAAFRAARAAGFRSFETDLRATADGSIVLSHDPDPSRLGGPPVRIETADRATLARLRLPGDHPLLFWEAWAEEFMDAHWTLDLKRESAPQVIAELAKKARSEASQAEFLHTRVRFVTWSAAHERLLRTAFPEAVCYPGRGACYRAGLACLAGLPALAGLEAGRVYSLPPAFCGLPLYRKTLFQCYHRRGAKVLAYLPENDADTRRAIAAGCVEVLTNHVPLPPDNS